MTVKTPKNPNKLLIQHELVSIVCGEFRMLLSKYMSIIRFIGRIIPKKYVNGFLDIGLDESKNMEIHAIPIRKLIIRSKIMTR